MRLTRALIAVAAVSAALALPSLAHAQNGGRSASGATTKTNGDAVSGSYVGTASVPLKDSTITVPVSYTFTGAAPNITGTAVVPGQGSGTISHVVREGQRLRFRVTAPENRLLEHDGTVAANGTIEGLVQLDGKPVAKFRIVPGTLPAAKAPATKPKGA